MISPDHTYKPVNPTYAKCQPADCGLTCPLRVKDHWLEMVSHEWHHLLQKTYLAGHPLKEQTCWRYAGRLMLARLRLTLANHQDYQEALDQAKIADALTSLNDPRFKRILAQALLKNAQYLDALTHAEAAIERSQPKRQSKPQSAQGEPAYGLPAYSHLIASIAASRIGNHEKAARHLQLAKDTWPVEFQAGKEVIITAEKELLWFDTLAELNSLQSEAQQLLESESQ